MEIRNTVPMTALLMLKKDNSVLLMRRCNTGYADGNYCFPGGHVDKGEPIHQAMIREAYEEIGIKIDVANLHLKHILNRKVKDNAYVDFVFECTQWQGKPHIMEPDKSDHLEWFDMNNLPANIIPFMQTIFNNYQNDVYIPYGWDLA